LANGPGKRKTKWPEGTVMCPRCPNCPAEGKKANHFMQQG
jgi:hypothetical protein